MTPSDLPPTLCQPRPGLSCGACCVMYNARDTAHTTTTARLLERTHAFQREARVSDPRSLATFRARWEPPADSKFLGDLPTCPFLGLLDAVPGWGADDALRARVGCMVHPLQNDGVDGRDCGVYDRHICEDYLCAAHNIMTAQEKWLVVMSTPDSYLYGLVITDVRFVRALFEGAAARNGGSPTPRTLARADALSRARDYFELKRDWPWRAADGVFGQVIPETGLEVSRRARPAESLGVPEDPVAPVLLCLGTHVASLDQLERARDLVRARIHSFARAVDL